MSDYVLGSWLIVGSLVLLIGTGAVVIYGFALIQEGRRGGGCGGGCRRRPARQGSNHVRGLDGVGLRAFTTKEND
jgi:hypothetical protein